jgi:hypothetical protein
MDEGELRVTHDELLAKIDEEGEFLVQHFDSKPKVHSALRAVVVLHKPEGDREQQCAHDKKIYPCPTIQEIEKELR